MGRLALVDFALVKEICENLKVNRKKFKGQLDLGPENGAPKTDKKVKAIKRLLVSGAGGRKSGKPSRKKRKNTPERFRQNTSKQAEWESTSDSTSTTSESDLTTSEIESGNEDGNQEEPDSFESDQNTDTNGETG